jgi:hypothetical protein
MKLNKQNINIIIIKENLIIPKDNPGILNSNSPFWLIFSKNPVNIPIRINRLEIKVELPIKKFLNACTPVKGDS